jgi:hypothetical protein
MFLRHHRCQRHCDSCSHFLWVCPKRDFFLNFKCQLLVLDGDCVWCAGGNGTCSNSGDMQKWWLAVRWHADSVTDGDSREQWWQW